jgi:hypothetical protein
MHTAALLLHTAALPDSHTVPHSATHCHTLTHTAGQLHTAANTATHNRRTAADGQVHWRTHPCALPQISMRTAAHCRTITHCRTAAHCHSHCHTLSLTLPHIMPHCRTLPCTLPQTAACTAAHRTLPHCFTMAVRVVHCALGIECEILYFVSVA